MAAEASEYYYYILLLRTSPNMVHRSLQYILRLI